MLYSILQFSLPLNILDSLLFQNIQTYVIHFNCYPTADCMEVWLNSLLLSPTVYFGVSSGLFLPRPHSSNLLISLPSSVLFFKDGRPASVLLGRHSPPRIIVNLQFLATMLPLFFVPSSLLQ